MKIRLEDVVLSLNLAPRITGAAMDITCPSCGNKCLHFDFGEQVFACPVCYSQGVGGGVMDAWAYFREIEGRNKKETRALAKKDLEEYYGNDPTSKKAYKKAEYKKPVEIASETERDVFYRQVLKKLSLSKEHLKNLESRGLNRNQINNSGIKSYRKLSSRELEELFPGQDLGKYPGFYMKDGHPHMVDYGPGMMILEKNVNGKIQGFQIRRDTSDKKRRYITLSSARYGGASGPTFTHYANWKNVPVTKCIITEGPLKGAIINYLTDIPVLAIPGVSSQKYLIEALKELKKQGLKEVQIAFDMDFYTKEGVQKALADLRKKLSDLELPFYQLKWDAKYKGYDDYLAAKKASV